MCATTADLGMTFYHRDLFAAFGKIHCGTFATWTGADDNSVVVELFLRVSYRLFIGHLDFRLLPARDAMIIAAEIQGAEVEKPTSVGFSTYFT